MISLFLNDEVVWLIQPAGDLLIEYIPTSTGAMCIDGSPVAYYIRRNTSNTNWAFYFEGGKSIILVFV